MMLEISNTIGIGEINDICKFHFRKLVTKRINGKLEFELVYGK